MAGERVDPQAFAEAMADGEAMGREMREAMRGQRGTDDVSALREQVALLYGDVRVLTRAVMDACALLRVTDDDEADWPKLPRAVEDLLAERDRALDILSPGRLFEADRPDVEVPTTLVERARWVAHALGAEAQEATRLRRQVEALAAERDEARATLRDIGEAWAGGQVSAADMAETIGRWMHAEIARTARLTAERDAERARADRLARVLAEIVDPNPCWLDHHGGCQEHGWLSGDCAHARAKQLLAADADSQSATGGDVADTVADTEVSDVRP